MQGPFLRKYGVQTTVNFHLFEVDGVDFRVDAADGGSDCSIMKDEGDEATCTNDFTDEGTGYSLVLTATEMEAARIVVYVVDTATKVWLDTAVVIETYGHASAMHAIDLDDSVRAGLTALPNAAADAAGGLAISDAGELDLDAKLANTNEITAARMGALTDWINGGRLDNLLDAIPTTAMRGTNDAALASGVDLTHIMGTILTEGGAGRLAAAFIKLLDVAAPLLVASEAMRGTNSANTVVPDAAGVAPTAAEINAEVDTALSDIHLDHLLAATYDPASKPGAADALLNEIVESDDGVSRFTENALEQAPSGTGASAATIADAVWNEDQADHVGAGTFGIIASEIASILEDTGELQADDIPTLLAAIAGYLDTEIAAIVAAVITNAAGDDVAADIIALKAVADAIPTTEMRGTDSAALASVCTEERLAELDEANLPTDIDTIKAKTDNQPAGIPKNVALSNFEFFMVLSSDHITPATGKTLTEEISKDGGAFAGCSNAASEISAGVYKIDLTQTEMNADIITLKFTEAACDQRTITIKTSA